MEAKDVVIEGLEVIIERDLNMHKEMLSRAKTELLTFKESRSHEIKKKRHYRDLLGNGKYSDKSLKSSMNDIAINIRHMSDKVDTTNKLIEHETLIVDTLTEQLADQNSSLRYLNKYREDHGT